jgi:hypothetical protein
MLQWNGKKLFVLLAVAALSVALGKFGISLNFTW